MYSDLATPNKISYLASRKYQLKSSAEDYYTLIKKLDAGGFAFTKTWQNNRAVAVRDSGATLIYVGTSRA